MLFNSLTYALFLPVVAALYFLAPLRWRAALLLVASYIFYAAWNPLYLPLIIALTAANYGFGLWLQTRQGMRTSRVRLALAVGANLAVLAFYKYFAFIADNLAALLGLTGLVDQLGQAKAFIPLGISFFTFEFVHYVADVWSGEPPERSPLRFAVFAAFFPTQIAGPIKRYESFIPQLDEPAKLDWARVGEGAALIARGLFKKMVLADNLAPLVSQVFDRFGALGTPLNPGDGWLAVVGFAMQVYFDFSGYTDVGCGSAQILGFQVPENFHRPFLATNVSELWRRWHISLSSWLRDYLYIPLGGARAHRYRNVLITLALGGLWHGASWNFVIWGVFHGLLLAGYWGGRTWMSSRQPLSAGLGTAVTFAGWLSTFGLFCFSLVFFRSPTNTAAWHLAAALLGSAPHAPYVLQRPERALIIWISIGTLLIEAIIELLERYPLSEGAAVTSRLFAMGRALRPAGYAVLVAIIIVFHQASQISFIYFQF